MKVKADFYFWNTLYEYLDKDEFKLNGDIVHDARIIERVKYLWQNASKKYLKNVEIKNLTTVWINIDEFTSIQLNSYKGNYETFISYLFYATDRMNPNRWLSLQMLINRASDLVYKDYYTEYGYNSGWTEKIKGGWSKNYSSVCNLELNCRKEWKETILPLIKKVQKNED